jgi:hypothetical protein
MGRKAHLWSSDPMDGNERSERSSVFGSGLFAALAPVMPAAAAALSLLGPAIFLSRMPLPWLHGHGGTSAHSSFAASHLLYSGDHR